MRPGLWEAVGLWAVATRALGRPGAADGEKLFAFVCLSTFPKTKKAQWLTCLLPPLLCFSQHASVIILRRAGLNKGFRGMLLLLGERARGRKELVIAAVWLKSFRSQSCLYVTHTVILFGGGKAFWTHYSGHCGGALV